jgi:hypothetical protein
MTRARPPAAVDSLPGHPDSETLGRLAVARLEKVHADLGRALELLTAVPGAFDARREVEAADTRVVSALRWLERAA